MATFNLKAIMEKKVCDVFKLLESTCQGHAKIADVFEFVYKQALPERAVNLLIMRSTVKTRCDAFKNTVFHESNDSVVWLDEESQGGCVEDVFAEQHQKRRKLSVKCDVVCGGDLQEQREMRTHGDYLVIGQASPDESAPFTSLRADPIQFGTERYLPLGAVKVKNEVKNNCVDYYKAPEGGNLQVIHSSSCRSIKHVRAIE